VLSLQSLHDNICYSQKIDDYIEFNKELVLAYKFLPSMKLKI